MRWSMDNHYPKMIQVILYDIVNLENNLFYSSDHDKKYYQQLLDQSIEKLNYYLYLNEQKSVMIST